MAEENQFICPQCHSDNIQKYEVLYMNGTSTSNSTTVGAGIFGSAGGGVANTTTHSQSHMAATVAPPQKKGYVKKFILFLVLFEILAHIVGSIGDTVYNIASIVAFVAAGYLVYQQSYLWNRDVYPQLLEQWHHSYVCMKCGNRFTL